MGEFAKSFRDLDVYQEALALALEVHEFAKTLPVEERYEHVISQTITMIDGADKWCR